MFFNFLYASSTANDFLKVGRSDSTTFTESPSHRRVSSCSLSSVPSLRSNVSRKSSLKTLKKKPQNLRIQYFRLMRIALRDAIIETKIEIEESTKQSRCPLDPKSKEVTDFVERRDNTIGSLGNSDYFHCKIDNTHLLFNKPINSEDVLFLNGLQRSICMKVLSIFENLSSLKKKIFETSEVRKSKYGVEFNSPTILELLQGLTDIEEVNNDLLGILIKFLDKLTNIIGFEEQYKKILANLHSIKKKETKNAEMPSTVIVPLKIFEDIKEKIEFFENNLKDTKNQTNLVIERIQPIIEENWGMGCQFPKWETDVRGCNQTNIIREIVRLPKLLCDGYVYYIGAIGDMMNKCIDQSALILDQEIKNTRYMSRNQEYFGMECSSDELVRAGMRPGFPKRVNEFLYNGYQRAEVYEESFHGARLEFSRGPQYQTVLPPFLPDLIHSNSSASTVTNSPYSYSLSGASTPTFNINFGQTASGKVIPNTQTEIVPMQVNGMIVHRDLTLEDFFENFEYALGHEGLRELRGQIREGIKYLNMKGVSKEFLAARFKDLSKVLWQNPELTDTKIGNGGCQELGVVATRALRRKGRILTDQEKNLFVLVRLLDDHCTFKRGPDSCLGYDMPAYYQELQDVDKLIQQLKDVKEADKLKKKDDFNKFSGYLRMLIATMVKVMFYNNPLDPTHWRPNAMKLSSATITIPTDFHAISFERAFEIIEEEQIPVVLFWQHIRKSTNNPEGALYVDAIYNMAEKKELKPDEPILGFQMYSTNLSEQESIKVESSMKTTTEINSKILEWSEFTDNDGKSNLRFDDNIGYLNGVYGFTKVKSTMQTTPELPQGEKGLAIVHVISTNYSILKEAIECNKKMNSELNLNGPRKKKADA